MPAPQITRYDIIIPKECVVDEEYGNLSVTTTLDQEIKVNKKHESLHSLFQEAQDSGRALKIGYAVYMNKEYVHTAEFYDGQFENPPPEEATGPQATKSKSSPSKTPKSSNASSEMTKEDWLEKDRITRKSIERQKSLELAINVANLFQLKSANKILDIAEKFEYYLEKGNLGKLAKEAQKMGKEDYTIVTSWQK